MDTQKPIENKGKPLEKDVISDTEKEIGGFEKRPEPTRFGDWEVNGRCSDF
ncbi:MAG: DUF1674 domain-containing protein [Alphaproteobacteria bacterium]|nr:DUF1674 domain-containing protein [Alphaproteobacteria bacterium]